MNKLSASVVGPDPDGKYWITLEADEIRASVPVRGTGIVGQVMAAFTGQPALVPMPRGSAAVQLKAGIDFLMKHERDAAEATLRGDGPRSFLGIYAKPADLLDTLQSAIDRAEHAPGQWSEGLAAGGSIAFGTFGGLSPFNEIGKMGHRRDALLAIAAVNALPELLERLRLTEQSERSADREVERLQVLAREAEDPNSGLNQKARCWDGIVTLLDELVPDWTKPQDSLFNLAIAAIRRMADASGQTQAAADVLAERRRQVTAEGWNPEHDDEHGDESMAAAAGCYALHAYDHAQVDGAPAWWPWEQSWWKPGGARRNLVKAGALILAEIERLDRKAFDEGEARMEPIGQNGPTGEHYAELAELAIQQGGKPVEGRDATQG